MTVSQDMTESLTKPLESLSASSLLLSTIPLFLLAGMSYFMGTGLESPIIVGTIRTFVQLAILGYILKPIFFRGKDLWVLVVGYVLFMVILASIESSSRTKYLFKGQLMYVLGGMLLNIALVSLFAFGLVIQPDPVWSPQYVIPIAGMLLGNSINGVSLSLTAMMNSFVESSREIELYLSFGATKREASVRLVREAVRTGAMPQLNSMAVTGLISIPGMMTGQILGGSPVLEAAKYQMLIMYLIAMCVFGIIFFQVVIMSHVAFDTSHRLRSDRFKKRPHRSTFLAHLNKVLRCCFERHKSGASMGAEEVMLRPTQSRSSYDSVEVDGRLQIQTLVRGSGEAKFVLRDISRNIDGQSLFRKLSLTMSDGEIVTVTGPSGVGKSQFLRLVSLLSPLANGSMTLAEMEHTVEATRWRLDVRYVTQYKIDIPGTPRDFVARITAFTSWKRFSTITEECLIQEASELVQTWGIGIDSLDKDWIVLSGGEAQRIILAIALASRPKVLLMDESTSALDVKSKISVEMTTMRYAEKFGMMIMWITHDKEQISRMVDF